MNYSGHLRTAGGALRRWFVAQCYDATAVASLWALGLLIIGVPLWPVWAVLGGAFQFIPNFGPILTLIGPAFAVTMRELFSDTSHWDRLLYVLILYAIIVVIDGLILQPYLMKRTNKVPIWASIITPLVLGFFFSFWGVLASAPLLAIVYAFRNQRRSFPSRFPPPPAV